MKLHAAPIGLLLLVILAGCSEQIFSESGAIEPYVPPEPRNACEREFASRLMQDIGGALVAPPTPEPDAVAAILDACSPEQLVEADEHYTFAVGQQMARLLHRRLLNAAMDPTDALMQLCQDDRYADTQACADEASR